MRALIALGGPVRDYQIIRQGLQQKAYDLLIAADGGLRHFHQLDCPPDCLLGDMDSIRPIDREWLERAAAPAQALKFPVEKDWSDAELCADYACKAGADSLTFLGIFGSVRPDHSLMNLQLMTRLAPKLRAAPLLTDGLTWVWTLRGPVTHTTRLSELLPLPYTISLIAATRTLKGVSYQGLRYPLQDRTIRQGSSLAISNQAEAAEFTVRLASGTGWLIVTPADD
ncbi:MAG: thiamine diphosphokinase [Oscillospiraceae bacterium]|nr:thiamine diphosphokinase [Oscillospiraceae bacterium]MDD4368084.1 thiamine diphosphokinase [Oscillospiraceae bacterium]